MPKTRKRLPNKPCQNSRAFCWASFKKYPASLKHLRIYGLHLEATNDLKTELYSKDMTLHFNSSGKNRFRRTLTTHSCQAPGCRRPISGAEAAQRACQGAEALHHCIKVNLTKQKYTLYAYVLLPGIAVSQPLHRQHTRKTCSSAK